MLALVANLSLATSIFLVAFVPLYVSRRRRDRRRLDAMRAAEAAAEREEAALAALMAESGATAGIPGFDPEREEPRG